MRVPSLAMVSLGVVHSHLVRLLSSTMAPLSLPILGLEKAMGKISSVSNNTIAPAVSTLKEQLIIILTIKELTLSD